MSKRIATDGYLRVWNDTLFANATTAYNRASGGASPC